MKKYLLLLLAITFSLQKVMALSDQLIQANGLIFHTDLEKPSLNPGENAVFPYSDEATLLLELASQIKDRRAKAFSLVKDPFCGDGKSGLPLISHHIAEKLIGSDINPRAVEYAKENAKLNHLEAKSCFLVRDITQGVEGDEAPGNTLWLANPPFALKAKGTNLDLMRDGGENGLTLTLAFVEKALTASQPGDVILGIGYSRIATDGSIELEGELRRAIQKQGGTLEMVLLQGQKLWRGYNGKKEQNNPMTITEEIFALKANPLNPEELSAYRAAAQFHNSAGFDQLGYYAYIIYR